MYNENIKRQFMSTLSESYANDFRLLFGRSEPFESKLNQDIARFSVDEIGSFFEAGGLIEPSNLRTQLGMLATYGDWCLTIASTPHHFRDYHVEDFPYAKLFKPLVIETPEKLCTKMEMVYPLDSGQPAMVALCLAWLGIDCGDALKLRNEQVDTKNGQIISPTGEVLVASMPECIRKMLDVYGKTRSAERVQNRTFTVYADDIGFFIKRMLSANSSKEGKPITKNQITSAITELRSKFNGTTGNDQTLTYGNVQRSGGFYRLRKMDLAGVDIRSNKNSDKVRMCLGKSKRNHKDNMLMYDAYLEVIGVKEK